jgi:hypothetical protein
MGAVIKGSLLLVYGKGGTEAQTRPKYQGKRYYFDLQLIGFLSNLSRGHEKNFFMVIKWLHLSEKLSRI